MSSNEQFKLLRSKLLDLRRPALLELIRMASSGRLNFTSHDDIVAVGEYHPISVAGEAFFEEPWSTGPDVATVLHLAWSLGHDVVRKELVNFAAEWAEYEKMFPPETEIDVHSLTRRQ